MNIFRLKLHFHSYYLFLFLKLLWLCLKKKSSNFLIEVFNITIFNQHTYDLPRVKYHLKVRCGFSLFNKIRSMF